MPSRISADSTMAFTPSKEENALVAQLFARGEPQRLGVLTGDLALNIFSHTNLSHQVLSDIWTIADKDGHGWLTPAQAAVAVRLIGWAQVGCPGLLTFLLAAGPLAHIPEVPVAGPSKVAASPAGTPSEPDPTPVAVPPFTPGDRAKFHRLFATSGPVDGLIDGGRARAIFAKSKLPEDTLSRIWELADNERRGALDRKGFTIALHLITGNGFIHDNYFSSPSCSSPNCLPDELARIWYLRLDLLRTLADINADGKLTREGFAIALFLIGERRQKNLPPAPVCSTFFTRFYASASLPARSNSVRFSSIWTPTSQLGLLAPPAPSPSSDTTIAHLNRQVGEMQQLILQLRQSHVEKAKALTTLTQENVSLRRLTDDPASHKAVNQVLVKENESLRTSLQELKELLQQQQASSSDIEMQRIQYEDLVRENERLHNQVDEMRESTTQLPWSGGDSELQTLINEDLAHENAKLRTEAREMQENVAQLQEATSGYEELRRANALLQTDATMGKSMDRQRREMGQLVNEVERLKAQGRNNATGGPSRRAEASRSRAEADVPPPAYNELDASLVLS
ncbi:hypothetical protein C8R46DRAFT_1073777 [Mycena filopes]|nr:hypothetical protein C8R46DRAFT_1073777 [Mycena filopes]